MGLKNLEEKPAPRMTAEARRLQIVDVAISLFSQKGFRGTTTKEIALAAGVNEAIIFRHFATKKDLYSAILDQKACSLSAQDLEYTVEELMNRKDDRAVFQSIAVHILETHEQDDAFMRLFLYSALEKHELADMFYRNHISNRYRRLAGYIEQRTKDRAYRPVDPMTAAHAFIGMIVYHAQLNKFYGRELLNISNQEAAKRFTEIFLGGTLAPSVKRPPRAKRMRQVIPVE
ncbi:MAG: TetR family transcriptional regulator [Acidobacteriota bacterium]